MHRYVFFVAACLLPVAASRADPIEAPVARAFGIEIRCADLLAREPGPCGPAALKYLRNTISRRFIERHALHATEQEVRRLGDYNQAFERHDRAQRARKLTQLQVRLADANLAATERSRLEQFRDILLRLAAYEADVDAGREVRESIPEPTLRAWIETAKLDAALYARYGGVVGIAAHGPYAHGALNALIAEHLQRGDVQIFDSAIAAFLQSTLAALPSMVHPPGQPDFTPYWERPIPASYLPD